LFLNDKVQTGLMANSEREKRERKSKQQLTKPDKLPTIIMNKAAHAFLSEENFARLVFK